MTLFDRYIAVDWSAANAPRAGRDSIWIAEAGRESINPPTRSAAMAHLRDRLDEARRHGHRSFVGLDFVFGYPRGTAQALTEAPRWDALWAEIASLVEDADDNRSNRFTVAAELNRRLGLAHFWGHPPQHRYDDLTPRRPLHGYATLPERRLAEGWTRGPQPVWKLTGAGSVGSQALLGIARLQQLRAARPGIAVWPFETDFERRLEAPVVLAEIYPSLLPLTGTVLPRDREQVEACVAHFARLDAAGDFGRFLAAPPVSAGERAVLVAEEGWIAGVGAAAADDMERAA